MIETVIMCEIISPRQLMLHNVRCLLGYAKHRASVYDIDVCAFSTPGILTMEMVFFTCSFVDNRC